MGEHAQRYLWGLCRRPLLARPSWLSVRHPPHQEMLGMRALSRRSSPVLTAMHPLLPCTSLPNRHVCVPCRGPLPSLERLCYIGPSEAHLASVSSLLPVVYSARAREGGTMLVTQQLVLRRFCYATVPVGQLQDGPRPFTLCHDTASPVSAVHAGLSRHLSPRAPAHHHELCDTDRRPDHAAVPVALSQRYRGGLRHGGAPCLGPGDCGRGPGHPRSDRVRRVHRYPPRR